MERWQNKIAVVTGASSGIGSACVVDLVKAGMKVVALARREDRLKALRNGLPLNLQGNVYLMKCDVTNDLEVTKVFQWIQSNLGGVHVLINNAGILKTSVNLAGKNNSDDIKAVVDTNVMGLVYCVREAFQLMKAEKFPGHIILINSISGHSVPFLPCNFNIYHGTKYAVTAMTETYRQEFSREGTNVKITSISPGAVDTEILPEVFKQNEIPMLKSEDISSAIMYCLSTPPNVQIHDLIIKPLHEKF